MFKAKHLATLASVTVAITFWLPIAPSQLVWAASACADSAGRSGNINLSSKVRTSSVVLCGDWAKITKPSVPAAPKKIVAKPFTQSGNKTPGSTIVYTHSVVAAPSRPKISATPGHEVAAASLVVFRPVTQPVIRYRYLLGIPTQIRFTPVAYFWRLSDGKTSRAKNLRHRVATSGSLVANLKVSFAVHFRFASGGAWHPFDKAVHLTAIPIKLNVGSAQTQSLKPRYVLFNCLQRPEGPGCRL